MLHALELLSHLIALFDSFLQLFANVHDYLTRALEFLIGIVRCARGATGPLRDCGSLEMRSKLVI